jgi:acetyl esterase/lipase
LAPLLSEEPAPLDLGDPLAARRISRERAAERNARPYLDEVVVAEHSVPGPDGRAVTVRAYTPRTRADPLPALVYFHGGAFVLGDLETEDQDCRLACMRARCAVLSVEYRLAPENPFPAATEDAFLALLWAATEAASLGVDGTRLAVGGSSAGGCVAAAAALMARDRGGPALRLQQLTYPVLDDRLRTPSAGWLDTPIFNGRSAVVMWDHYLGSADRTDLSPYAAPARAPDLSGLPPTYILAAGVDPLRDEALDYARRLLDAGVPVELHLIAGAVHGFEKLGDTELGRRAALDRDTALFSALHS